MDGLASPVGPPACISFVSPKWKDGSRAMLYADLIASEVSGPARECDWDLISAGWGMRVPADYIDFMQELGPGVLGGYLSIMAPSPDLEAVDSSDMALETQDARVDWDDPDAPKSSRLAAATPVLICWGVSNDANRYCWDVSDGARSTYVHHRDADMWDAFPWSFSDFLSRLVGGNVEGGSFQLLASHYLGWRAPVSYVPHESPKW